MKKNILLEEVEFPISSKLARVVGIKESIVLRYINKCLLENEEKGINYIDGRYWVQKSIKGWQKEVFSFWNENTVKRVFSSLQSRGILIGCKLSKGDFDHTKWYTIDYEELDYIISVADKNKVYL